MINFMDTLGRIYPRVQASCFTDPTVYDNLVWEGGDPLPTESEMVNAELAAEKDAAWEKIKTERDRRKAGGVQVADYWYHSDDTSRIQQIGLVLLGQNIPAGLMWKTMSGAFVQMTPSLASRIFQTIAGKDTQIFAVAEQHRANMIVSPDPANYDFSQGWPLTFEEA